MSAPTLLLPSRPSPSAAVIVTIALMLGMTGIGLEEAMRSARPASAHPAAAVAAPAQRQILFFDGELLDANWDQVVFQALGGGRTSVVHALAGGNPGPFRHVLSITVPWSGTGDKPQIVGVHLRRDAVYEPVTSGPVTCFDFSEDVKMFAGYGEGENSGPAVLQAGRTYVAIRAGGVTGTPVNWTRRTVIDLHDIDFFEVYGDPMAMAWTSHPDFSAAGAPITFGFYRANTDTPRQQDIGIDNWTITRCGVAVPPSPTPQDTTVPPSPTPSPFPTPSPTPQDTEVPPTPTPSRTEVPPTPTPHPIYLPIALQERCPAADMSTDVVLVLDASSSMNERVSSGRTKFAEAKAAVGAFLDGLRLSPGPDRAALVTFNDRSQTAVALTGDRSALQVGLDAITLHELTRIDLGLSEATAELDRNTAGGRVPVVVLLSDGIANPVGPDAILAAAGRLKGRGADVYVVGLGTNQNVGMLRALSSGPSFYVAAPDESALTAVLRTLSHKVACPPRAYWGGR